MFFSLLFPSINTFSEKLKKKGGQGGGGGGSGGVDEAGTERSNKLSRGVPN